MNIFILSSKIGGGNLFLLERFSDEHCRFHSVNIVDKPNIIPQPTRRMIPYMSLKNKYRHYGYVIMCFCFMWYILKTPIKRKMICAHVLFAMCSFILPRTKLMGVVLYLQDYELGFYRNIFIQMVLQKALRVWTSKGGIIKVTNESIHKKFKKDGVVTSVDEQAMSVLVSLAEPSTDMALYRQRVKKDYDFLMCLRNGQHKRTNLAKKIAKGLAQKNNKLVVVNFTDAEFELPDPSLVIEELDRESFLRLMCRCKTFINTSKWEGFGLPNLEAHFLGLKIISDEIPSSVYIRDVLGCNIEELNEFVLRNGL